MLADEGVVKGLCAYASTRALARAHPLTHTCKHARTRVHEFPFVYACARGWVKGRRVCTCMNEAFKQACIICACTSSLKSSCHISQLVMRKMI